MPDMSALVIEPMPERPALSASQNSRALFPKPEMTPTPVITTLLTLCII
jgi:hypothetical protein